jgi:predicted Rossmann fold flavoprotein
LAECQLYEVEIALNCSVEKVQTDENGCFLLQTSRGAIQCRSVVIASGGLSIPKIGATPFGYKIAEQFGINVLSTRAGLAPLTLDSADKERFSVLTGIAVSCVVQSPRRSFKENLLFTHRGLSGPAILQISSYWQPGEALTINLLPEINLFEELKQKRRQGSQARLQTVLGELLPKRLVQTLVDEASLEFTLANCADKQLRQIASALQEWQIKPNGSEGYRTAEVTLGGVDCDAISSKTMESKQVPGLFFVGEVLDVSGWLGGYNFQWAWSSGWCAGQFV